MILIYNVWSRNNKKIVKINAYIYLEIVYIKWEGYILWWNEYVESLKIITQSITASITTKISPPLFWVFFSLF